MQSEARWLETRRQPVAPRVAGSDVPLNRRIAEGAREAKPDAENPLFTAGLRVETAAEPTWEAGAYDNADFGARLQDKRQGWRGPEWRIDGAARELFLARQRDLYGAEPLVPGARYLALVDKVKGERAEVLIGTRRFQLPFRNMKWASKWVAGNADNDIEAESAGAVLKPGFVVWVSRETRTKGKFRSWQLPDGKNPAWVASDDQTSWDESHTDVVKLEQVPHPQTAIFTGDHRSGHVVAMVGVAGFGTRVMAMITGAPAPTRGSE